MNNLANIEEKADFFDDLNLSHSKFQIENFILGADQGVTIWGKYKQCLRELHTRLQGLKEINYKIEKNKIKIRKMEQDLSQCHCSFDKEELQLDIDYQKDGLKSIELAKEEILKEGSIFLESYNYLKTEIDNILLKGTTKEDLEKEYWMQKLKQDLEHSTISSSGVNKGLLQAILGIEDKDMIQEIMGHFANVRLQSMLDNKILQEKALHYYSDLNKQSLPAN